MHTNIVRHLLFHVPDDWTNDRKGDLFESFIGEILRPMRFSVERRLRVTGMEIDILAKGLDQPRTILVECKAQRDALPADTISKLLGNVTIRGADAGWLFSTSDLSKDGRGQWEEIRNNPELARRFSWYPPTKLLDILIDQGTIVAPDSIHIPTEAGYTQGDATLICHPSGKAWLFEILDGGLPAFFVAFDAPSGIPLAEEQARQLARISERFASLRFMQYSRATEPRIGRATRAPVARVVSGDAWDDLRPARPIDFVGRDDVIQDIMQFINAVREGETTTRTFAIQGPSGWGKSSLVLKLNDIAIKGRRIPKCSFTSIDSRSATNSGFVSSALRTALVDARDSGLISLDNRLDISSLTYPLDSHDVAAGITELSTQSAVVVLVFDQFEELFTKETLFETFNAIRELSLDLDNKQIPIVLGFAWKTDVSLPQQHPAYHLWHELADRRRDFKIRQFGTGDIAKVISKAEREISVKLSPALRARLVEQCQGYPWLLKKLLVHVGKRLQATTSQYALLERELDVEVLFKEDVAGLKPEQLRCLKYVAERAPAYVSEVEEHFRPETTNSLLSKRLLVRSGLNYVVYWDIFRDYLTEGRVPQIPWARTFQRDPRSAVLAAQAVQAEGKASAKRVAKLMNATERGCVNVMSDLVALQIVDRVAEDQYKLAQHIKSTSPADLAEIVHGQLARHVVCRELAAYDRDAPIDVDDLEEIVRKMKSGIKLSDRVVHQYAMSLRRWLLFAGHLEERDSRLYRPAFRGAQMGQIESRRSRSLRFLGCGTPDSVVSLLRRVLRHKQGVHEGKLVADGFRNALYDAHALGLVERNKEKRICLTESFQDIDTAIEMVKIAVLNQHPVQLVAAALSSDPAMTSTHLGEKLRVGLQENWKPSSAVRYANGLRRYLNWTQH